LSLSLPHVSSSSLSYLPFSETSSLIFLNKNKQTDGLNQNATSHADLFPSNYDNLISGDFYSLPAGVCSEFDSNSTVNVNAVLIPIAITNVNSNADICGVTNANASTKMNVVAPMNLASTDMNVYDTINSNITTNAIFWMSSSPDNFSV
ncbi:5677_t:CDS:1, partial [Acaulospora colombiana]